MMAFAGFCSNAPDARRWMYASAVMVERLGKMIERKYASEGLIPKGVFLGLQQRFFQPIISSDGSSDSISVGYVVANALARLSLHTYSLDQFDEMMRRFASFFDSLNEDRVFSSDDLEMAENMKRFFWEIQLAGEQRIAIPL